jgi:hypothetical protein
MRVDSEQAAAVRKQAHDETRSPSPQYSLAAPQSAASITTAAIEINS